MTPWEGIVSTSKYGYRESFMHVLCASDVAVALQEACTPCTWITTETVSKGSHGVTTSKLVTIFFFSLFGMLLFEFVCHPTSAHLHSQAQTFIISSKTDLYYVCQPFDRTRSIIRKVWKLMPPPRCTEFSWLDLCFFLTGIGRWLSDVRRRRPVCGDCPAQNGNQKKKKEQGRVRNGL